VIPVLGVVAILWARRRFGRATVDPDPAATSLTGAAEPTLAAEGASHARRRRKATRW